MSKEQGRTATGASPAASAAASSADSARGAAPHMAGAAAVDWTALSPARLWRDWIVKSEAQWSETLSTLLKDERVGDTLNRQLSELQLAHRQFSELAQASLAAANLPSRSDLEALDERMGRLEDGLAQVAAGLAQLTRALSAAPAADAAGTVKAQRPSSRVVASASPARTRRPAPAAKNGARQA